MNSGCKPHIYWRFLVDLSLAASSNCRYTARVISGLVVFGVLSDYFRS